MSSSPLARGLRDLERLRLLPSNTCVVEADGSNLLSAVDDFDALVLLNLGDPDHESIAVVQEGGEALRVLLELVRDVELFYVTGELDFRIRPSALAALGLAHSSTEPHSYVILPDGAPGAQGGTGAGVAPAVGGQQERVDDDRDAQ